MVRRGLPHRPQEFLRGPAKTLPKPANAGEKQNESNLDRKFDQKLKANAIFAEEFSGQNFFHAVRNRDTSDGAPFYKWSCFTATSRIDPQFGMHFLCTETKWTTSSH